ncbi:class I SAM-dependent methyltransferase [Roseitranquillus sediminis]|uniref:class I SAM-dependent methyltransferase n=1 Tax=Roseitranquillus sediminis TaxID=2809051 RepID=UPI001D0C0A5F|nr:methyltransferase domain-containing protein [Roseitranquillus sediminis]MBM9595889.1 methyltransferase domain-containing protein [Roseitranquillus sediminis]
MHLDVQDLRTFYYRTRLGRAAQRAIRSQVLALWPQMAGLSLVGFGFAVPLLRPYLPDARRVVALMPGQQGVMPWPPGLPNVSVLCPETLWPLPPASADRIIFLHGLETSEHPTSLLEEAERVLAPEGRILFIVPNRAGLWARRDRTPFGFGRPYSLGQLEVQLKRQGFLPERHVAALFQPPTEQEFWLRTGAFWEEAGRRISNRYAGGILMVEATRRVAASSPPGLPERARRPLRILDGIAAPEPKPA